MSLACLVSASFTSGNFPDKFNIEGLLLSLRRTRDLTKTIKRECPRRPRGITKIWHMLEKFIFLIFRPNIPHGELINVVYFSSSDLLFFFLENSQKTVQDANR